MQTYCLQQQRYQGNSRNHIPSHPVPSRRQVPRTKMLLCATKMVSECKVPVSLIYVGKKQPDPPPADLAKRAAACTDDGRLLEVERADFGVLFRQAQSRLHLGESLG